MLYALGQEFPYIHPEAFIAPSAELIGAVSVGAYSSVWFHCTLRADGEKIEIGEYSNIQDNSVLHISTGKRSTVIGNHVTVGHHCVIHAATLKDYAFVGMGSIVMDGAVVESFGFVAAGTLVLPNFVVPERTLVAGVPAKVVRRLRQEEEGMILETAKLYAEKAKSFRQNLQSYKTI
ncbi:MAG: gamma carbonic anhydrase family protein [Leptospiraceae bacterium]|nr:gamma carbonic anhydrase family protein [Leptospiraceae bacterium]MDW8305987.1 gamma carbonic anhydrase family protein [Leptospiraceae bacterium]